MAYHSPNNDQSSSNPRPMPTRFIPIIQQVCRLLTCVLVIVSLALAQYGELFGHSFESKPTASTDTLRTLWDGRVVVNTTPLAQDIRGFGGRVPLEITVKDSVITDIQPLPNSETPDFLTEALPILDAYRGKTIREAAAIQVDAVSGATYTSNALIGNMSRGLVYIQQQPIVPSVPHASPIKLLCGLIVVLAAAILPLFVHNKTYLLIQQLLDIVVLGFWCGMALSYSSLLGYVAHGVNWITFAVPAIMLITAFVYPLFGKKSYYCAYICPFGALQQVAGRCCRYKIPLSAKTLRGLNLFRQVLWAVLMLCIWSGVWSQWLEWEPFSAFLFRSASWVTLTIAAVFVALSFVVTRPYCRFVCPLGTLFKIGQSPN